MTRWQNNGVDNTEYINDGRGKEGEGGECGADSNSEEDNVLDLLSVVWEVFDFGVSLDEVSSYFFSISNGYFSLQ